MTRILAAMAAIVLAAAPAGAQTTAPTTTTTTTMTTAPAPAPPLAAQTTCTDVQVGSAQSYDCINAQLHALAGTAPRPSSQDAPLTAMSPGYQTGAANAAATANRLGSNYGKSAIAARPQPVSPPVFPHP